MAEIFGCCSSYTGCSNQRKCLHQDQEYSGCQYRRNLEAGRIFYGTMRGFTKKESEDYENSLSKLFTPTGDNFFDSNNAASEALRNKFREYELYLICYNQPFAIKQRRRDLSYPITEEQQQTLIEIFQILSIPHSTTVEFDDYTPVENPIEPDEACDSRVMFQFGEQEFNILNFNCYLIPERIAKKIAGAFEKKGFKSRVETQYHRPVIWPEKLITINARIINKSIEPEKPKKPPVYVQETIFNLMRAI